MKIVWPRRRRTHWPIVVRSQRKRTRRSWIAMKLREIKAREIRLPLIMMIYQKLGEATRINTHQTKKKVSTDQKRIQANNYHGLMSLPLPPGTIRRWGPIQGNLNQWMRAGTLIIMRCLRAHSRELNND